MSIDHTPILGIGKVFEELDEVTAYLVSKELLITPEDCIEFSDDYEEYFVEISVFCLNCFSGYRYFVGYQLATINPELFIADIAIKSEKWKTKFREETADIILDVRVW